MPVPFPPHILASNELSALVLFVALGALGVLIVLVMWRDFQARQRLGPVAITFDPGAPRLGETCRARVMIRPQGPVVIEAIDVRITAQERIFWTVRTSDRSQTRSKLATVYELQIPTRRPGSVAPPQVVSEAFEFTIPPEGPCSFQAPQNRLDWTVTVRVRFDKSIQTQRVFPLTVPPIRLVA